MKNENYSLNQDLLEPLEEYKKPEEELFELPDLESGKSLFSKVCCPSCDKEVPADHLNINDKIAKCGNCNVVFPFNSTIEGFQTTPTKMKQEILRPEGIELFYYKDEMEISYRRSFSIADALVFSLGPLMTIPIIGSILETSTSLLLVMLALTPIIFLTFFIVQRLRQKKYISVDKKQLIIHAKPNFLSKNNIYKISDIDQVYVKKKEGMELWEVMMIIDEGKGQKHVNLSVLKSAPKAKFLEQEIERHIGIQDREVPGEI